MITASPASVAPRVAFNGRQNFWPLVMVAQEFCATRDSGGLSIIGGDGAGKTTALAHLAAVLPDAEEIVFLDEPPLETAVRAAEQSKVIFTSRGHERIPNVSRLQLAPWSRDELIEYLLAVHPAQCRSVMARLSVPAGCLESPSFWTPLLDAMAADEQLGDLEQAIGACLDQRLRDRELHESVRWYCLDIVLWEQADLRDADLRGATFHLGSSRSGLIFTPIAGEGSRTGFYTDESLEQHFQSPEEIRKANLRGADLRGARLDGVDLYLVDLRDALLDPAQLALAQQTGAILNPT